MSRYDITEVKPKINLIVQDLSPGHEFCSPTTCEISTLFLLCPQLTIILHRISKYFVVRLQI